MLAGILINRYMWLFVSLFSIYFLLKPHKSMFRLFVAGLMPCLRYLCLLACSGVKNILCCVFALFFFVLCILCCQFLWIVHFVLPLRCSLKFIWHSRKKEKGMQIDNPVYKMVYSNYEEESMLVRFHTREINKSCSFIVVHQPKSQSGIHW